MKKSWKSLSKKALHKKKLKQKSKSQKQVFKNVVLWDRTEQYWV